MSLSDTTLYSLIHIGVSYMSAAYAARASSCLPVVFCCFSPADIWLQLLASYFVETVTCPKNTTHYRRSVVTISWWSLLHPYFNLRRIVLSLIGLRFRFISKDYSTESLPVEAGSSPRRKDGGHGRIQTDNLLLTRQLHYQLCYMTEKVPRSGRSYTISATV